MKTSSVIGLLFVALLTGLVFARFARPTAAVMFSDVAVVAPYQGHTGFMFRVANARSNQLMELEAKVLYSRLDGMARRYDQLKLERTKVVFFPLSWTIVHPIDESSPLYGVTEQQLRESDAEFLILLTGTNLPTPLYRGCAARFGFSPLIVTLIFASYVAVLIPSLLVAGPLSDAVGRRRVLLPAVARAAMVIVL